MNQSSVAGGIVTLSVQELETDPHGIFRHYRPRTPVLGREGGSFIVLRAADVGQLMRDSRVRQAETVFAEMQGVKDGALHEIFRFSMLTTNGEAHRQRRAPFSRTFAARMIAAMRPGIRQAAEELLDGWSRHRELELVGGYAALIPARTISTMLGLPYEDIPHFTNLVYSVSRFFSFTYEPEELEIIREDARELRDYVDRLLSDRRRSPCGDLLTGFLADADARDELSPIDIVIQIVTLIIGGTDTTRVAIASQVSLLLQHRAQWDAVCSDESLVHGAVAEALRFEPSVGSVARVTVEPLELQDVLIPPNRFLTLSTLSALRDETVYDRPDEFDIRRPAQRHPHMAFGGGAHRCLGEALARVELEESLSALARRLPQLRLAGPPARLQGHFGIRRIGEVLVVS